MRSSGRTLQRLSNLYPTFPPNILGHAYNDIIRPFAFHQYYNYALVSVDMLLGHFLHTGELSSSDTEGGAFLQNRAEVQILD